MTIEQIAHFRQLLESQLLELQIDKETTKDDIKPVALDQACVGRLSRMDAIQGQAMAVEASRRRDIQIQRIHSALARIESGDFGSCTDCGDDISIRRLETVPTAVLCIECASRQETDR